ncbi:hypothetical protein B0H11DRAFT_1920008 [Mycena galericulata]|nr:hypothetical protein B0H11DRAFT_1942078 [Mycena galericulata]KAJ7470196.1 hypothetical protein B0H11DRAFT_1920008 [Mycena galericulata]
MSSSSSVVMSGMIILENPQTISPRVIAFRASIYIGSLGLEDIRGYLRYFKPSNSEDTPGYPEVGLYSVTFTAAKMQPEFEINEPDEDERAKYHLVGDIKTLCLLQARDPDDPEAPWTINPCQQLCVHICCAVTSDDQTAATFTAAPEQYTSIAADAKRAAEDKGEVAAKSIFPLTGFFEDSPRFKNCKKPTPYTDRYCGFSGLLTGISSALEEKKMVDRFRIAVDTIAFMGSIPGAAPKAKATPQNFSFDNKVRAPGRTWSYSTPVTGNKRRKPNDDDAGPSSSPSTFN